jgi:hypothetical protein
MPYPAPWIIRGLVSPGPAEPFSAFDPATIAWVNAVITNGGTVSGTQEGNVDTLIRSLKSNSVFNKFDRLWLMASENTFQALTDIIADALATAHGSPTFTTNRGYNGVQSSTTVYIDTGFNPSLAVNYAQNNSHLSVWNVSGVGFTSLILAGYNATSEITFISESDVSLLVTAACEDSVSSTTYTANSQSGHFISQRTGANAEALYQNGNTTPLGTNSNASATPTNLNMYALALNNRGSPQSGSSLVLGALSFGSSLTNADITNFYNALRTYMTAVGVP